MLRPYRKVHRSPGFLPPLFGSPALWGSPPGPEHYCSRGLHGRSQAGRLGLQDSRLQAASLLATGRDLSAPQLQSLEQSSATQSSRSVLAGGRGGGAGTSNSRPFLPSVRLSLNIAGWLGKSCHLEKPQRVLWHQRGADLLRHHPLAFEMPSGSFWVSCCQPKQLLLL